VLVLDPGAVARAWQVRAAERLGDDALQSTLPGRGQHPFRVGNEVAGRLPAAHVVERQIEEKLAPALVGSSRVERPSRWTRSNARYVTGER
jgi:hypothetical protein